MAQKTEVASDLPASFQLAIAELLGVSCIHRLALGIRHLGDVGSPFGWVFLRPENRSLTGKLVLAGLVKLSLRHQCVDGGELTDRCQGLRCIHVADTKHRGRVQTAAIPVTGLIPHASKMRDVRIPRAINKLVGANSHAARFGLYHHRVNS